jgi:hypothetical protein
MRSVGTRHSCVDLVVHAGLNIGPQGKAHRRLDDPIHHDHPPGERSSQRPHDCLGNGRGDISGDPGRPGFPAHDLVTHQLHGGVPVGNSNSNILMV